MGNNIGAIPIQLIRQILGSGYIQNAKEENLQPSSLDLQISNEVYRMRGSYLPRRGESVRDIIRDGSLIKASLDQPLELNSIYLIRIEEILNFPEEIYAYTNNKSSTGRINLQTRLIANGVPRFDMIPKGYKGDLWLELIPKSFPIKLKAGEKLNQMRFFNGDSRLTQLEHRLAYDQHKLFYNHNGEVIPANEDIFSGNGITMTVDLTSQDLIGYKCSPTATKILDYGARNLNPMDYFEPIMKPADGSIVLRRDDFYVLFTKEFIRVPNEYAVEMIAYDPSKGEFRSHYAGFFDPGFGYGKDGTIKGAPGVLEVFTHDNDFVLRDGQPICRMMYEKLTSPAEIVYGDDSLSSNYYAQRGPRLSKHFNTKPNEQV